MVNIMSEKLAYAFCREILIPAQCDIWSAWQKANPGLHWTKNNLWDMCFFACLSRWIDPSKAAEIATRLVNETI